MTRATDRYAAARARGLCVRCGQPSLARTRCEACRAAIAARDVERHRRDKAARRCVDCRADLSIFDTWPHVRCFECHARNRASSEAYNTTPQGRRRHRARMARLYADRRAAGVCVAGCGRPTDLARCEPCTALWKLNQVAYLDRKEAAC